MSGDLVASGCTASGDSAGSAAVADADALKLAQNCLRSDDDISLPWKFLLSLAPATLEASAKSLLVAKCETHCPALVKVSDVVDGAAVFRLSTVRVLPLGDVKVTLVGVEPSVVVLPPAAAAPTTPSESAPAAIAPASLTLVVMEIMRATTSLEPCFGSYSPNASGVLASRAGGPTVTGRDGRG